MKSLEILLPICTLAMLLSGCALWLIFKKYPLMDASRASGAEKWLKLVVGSVFLISGLLSFVLGVLNIFT